jgi:hypothetical protein
MKPLNVILILVVAALSGVAIVTWTSEGEANERALVARRDADESIRANGAKVVAAERAATEANAKTKIAQAAEAAAYAKIESSSADAKKVVEDLAACKDALAKATTKVAELEKARSEAGARVNELNAEIAKLRDGSEVREATTKATKAEADLEAASIALREANAKAAAATTKLAEVEEENARLKLRSKGSENASPNYRPL